MLGWPYLTPYFAGGQGGITNDSIQGLLRTVHMRVYYDRGRWGSIMDIAAGLDVPRPFRMARNGTKTLSDLFTPYYEHGELRRTMGFGTNRTKSFRFVVSPLWENRHFPAGVITLRVRAGCLPGGHPDMTNCTGIPGFLQHFVRKRQKIPSKRRDSAVFSPFCIVGQ